MGMVVDYRNVVRDPGLLEEMLRLTGGEREVPVICQGEGVTVGWKGRS
ncbi:MAG: hypothetical protein ACYC8T_08740 [Myxococcaceae bacterium]